MKLAILALASTASLIAGSIEGRVTNAVTGEGVSGANITFLDRGSHPFRTTADSTGAYRLTGLDDGEYRSEFSKKGFTSKAELADVFNGGGWMRISGDVAAHLDAQLQPWGTLRGRVVDEDGNPAVNVPVEISYVLDGRVLTDTHGEFVFDELPPRSYTVVAKPNPATRIRDGERIGAVPVFYPSATQIADASPIEVKWGVPVAGIEIRLRSVPVRRVAGTVLDANGKPAAQATVRLLGPPSSARQNSVGAAISGPGPFVRGAGIPSFYTTLAAGPEPELARMETQKDGSFEFAAVPRGEWRVAAEIEIDDGKPQSGVSPAAIGERDVEDIAIHMSPAFSVEVTADWGAVDPPKGKDGNTVPTGYLVHLAAQEGQPQLTFDINASPTSVYGAFPGRYRVVRSIGLAGTWLAAVMYDGRDVMGQVIDLAPGAGPLHAIVRNDPGSIKGVVNGGLGATVVLVPRAAGDVIDYRSTSGGAGGAFEIKDVIPGDYYVAAFDRSGMPPAGNTADAIAPYATAVRIEPSSMGIPVSLPLNRWPW